LAVPPAAAAFRTQADSPTGRLQASLSDRGPRAAGFESLAEIDRAGRTTTAFNDSRTKNISESTEPLLGSPTDPSQESVIISLPEATSFKSEQSIQRSDSRGAHMVWIIIVVLTVCAGLVAFQLWRTRNRLSSMNDPQLRPSPQPTALVAQATPEVAASPVPSPATNKPVGMVFVPGGTFKMGRDDGDEFESPAHKVTVNPFYIDRTEVTNEEYQRFIAATGRRAPANWAQGKIPEGQAKFPVVNVSWNDADAFARWTSKRLPTEAEWEFAARGADGRAYPWGNDWKQDLANAGRGKGGGAVETGRYAAGASPFGALDMCGNVWEWTSTDFADYPGKKAPSSMAGAKLKVIRGGAYDVAPKRATTTYRGAISPDRVFDKTGFRCVRDAQ
jgi:formylglycine-generating enzyme required for sulfatase activity